MDVNSPPPPESPRTARGKGLGRGLAALIPGADRAQEAGALEIPVDRIRPNSLQPRAELDKAELSGLETSIREQGVLQPVLVRPSAGGYEIVAGERRWRAAMAAGLKTIPAVVRLLDDGGALEVALVENLQREDLSAIDRARAYRRLTDEFGLSQDAVARRVGLSQPAVANTLRLLSLPAEVLTSLEAGRITEGHARALLTVGDRERMLILWRSVEERGLSVRQTESAARKLTISREIPSRRGTYSDELNIIQQSLNERYGAPVRVTAGGSGKGEIRITFFSPADLERLLDVMGVRTRETG